MSTHKIDGMYLARSARTASKPLHGFTIDDSCANKQGNVAGGGGKEGEMRNVEKFTVEINIAV